jgi:hypothetical protein
VKDITAEFLNSLSEREAECARFQATQRLIQSEVSQFRAGDCLTRNEVHAPAVN